MIQRRDVATRGTSGCRPWESVDAWRESRPIKGTSHPGELYYRTDKREDIEKCLHCKWPECRNCLGQYV